MDATVVPVTTYLDHAATTPPRPEARVALETWLDAANASSPHAAGQRARIAVEEAREVIADSVHCSPHEVVFTSGGTESDNLAVKGIVWAARNRHRGIPHMVTTAVEHAAVLEPARWLAERGDVRLDVVDVGPDGRVDVQHVLDAVRPRTALVSVMTANNELGGVHDVGVLATALAERGIPMHSDAVQAMATLDVSVSESGLAAMSVSAHKIGGPQGVGFAVLRRDLPVVPLTHGGGQDRGVRSGTFAAALDAACGAAVRVAVAERASLRARLVTLSDRLERGLTAIDGVRRNGPADPDARLASHVHVSVDGVDADALGLALDMAGIAVASGAACGSGASKASHVLEAAGIVGVPIRFSLGWTSIETDVERAIEVVSEVVRELRRRGSVPAVPG